MNGNKLISAILLVSFLLFSVTYGSEEFNFDGKFYLLDNMEEINPDLVRFKLTFSAPIEKWDESGVLENIADRFATCESLAKKGMLDVNDLTPDGLAVKVFVDAGKGWGTDMHSVQVYVRHVVTRWTENDTYIQQFQKSEGVACMMQPGCDGFTVVSCAFSYRVPSDLGDTGTIGNYVGGKARAFTKDQYREVEKLTGKEWDRSHLLENLASYDAKCSMIGDRSMAFKETKSYAERWNIKIGMEYGSSENKGSTDKAVMDVISHLKTDTSAYSRIGCCLISDCTSSTDKKDQRVVVVCLYSNTHSKRTE